MVSVPVLNTVEALSVLVRAEAAARPPGFWPRGGRGQLAGQPH